MDFNALIAASDILVLHAPLTPGRHDVIGAEAISKRKPSAMIANTARGGLVEVLQNL